MFRRTALLALSLLVLGACRGASADKPEPAPSRSASAAGRPRGENEPRRDVARAERGALADARSPSAARAKSEPVVRDEFDPGFVRAFTKLSAPGAAFKGDNLVTNEVTYLEFAKELSLRTGGVYLGVGPEQNFSYIAHARPELAIIVDIRRDNALLHLLYKALFEVSSDRSDFVCRLLSRTCPSARAPGVDASVEQVLAYAASSERDLSGFSRRHAALVSSLRARQGLGLGPTDFATLRRFHREFMLRGLNLRFDARVHTKMNRPTLEKLLSARSAGGELGSFLATEEAFDFVRDLQRRDQVWFVTGDFGKPDVLPRLSRELRRQSRVVRAFYTSNVEQYLFGTSAWRVWQENLRQLPVDEGSLLLRNYLAEPPHPKQRPGQTMTSFTSPFSSWLRCERRAPSSSYLGAVSRAECEAVPASYLRPRPPD